MRRRTRKKGAGAKIRQIAANPLAAFAARILRPFRQGAGPVTAAGNRAQGGHHGQLRMATVSIHVTPD